MLSINCPKTKIIQTYFHHQCIDGIQFEVVEIQGFSVLLKHDHSDEEAKQIAKQTIAQLKELTYFVTTVRIVDEKGALI